MIDDDILPFDGGNTPDDAELSARLAAHYQETPAASARMVDRCIRQVRLRAVTPAVTFVSQAKRPWFAAAAAVAAIVLISVTMRSGTAPVKIADGVPVGGTTAVDHGSAVQFELRLPKGAAKVSVVGDFNGWDTAATPMTQNHGEGAWSAKIALLPGRHVYAYIVDGEKWTVDPLAPQVPDAGYGSPANALVVEGGLR